MCPLYALTDLRHAAGKQKQAPADWFIKRARLSLKVSTHSSRQRVPLHLDENANETFFIIGESLTPVSPAWTRPNQLFGALWLFQWRGESSELSTSTYAARHVYAITGIWVEYWTAGGCVRGEKASYIRPVTHPWEGGGRSCRMCFSGSKILKKIITVKVFREMFYAYVTMKSSFPQCYPTPLNVDVLSFIYIFFYIFPP